MPLVRRTPLYVGGLLAVTAILGACGGGSSGSSSSTSAVAAGTSGAARSSSTPEVNPVTTVGRKAGQAVRITYRADSAPDPVTGKTIADAVERYEFWHSGQEVALTLSGPTGADNVDPWKLVSDALQWVK
jgi:hypothetical protein